MNKISTSLLIAATLSSAVVFGEETPRTATETGKHRVEFTLHGNTRCVLVDDKVFCAPGTMRAPIKLASTAAN